MTDTAVIFDIIGRDRTSAAIASSSSAFNKFAIGIAASAAFAGDKLVNMAANFQQSMTRLVTGAGESQANIKLVSSGILDLAGKVGESTKDLASGMYLVESAGFHGADGLNVLKIAAMGAKVGNADMATVADAVTTALNAYHMSASDAAAATNALIAAEGQGKTNLEALSGSLSTVAPIAAVAHVSLNEVLGAMATMTGQGTDAASAATYLKQTIGQLSNPTAKAALEMKGLGLDAVKVSQNLGTNGLASTLKMLTDAITAKMGPAGVVLIQHLQKAASSTTDFQKVLANLPPTQQTYIGALANMVGGTKSMQAALELTGDNMAVFQHNTDVINEKVKAGGSTIEGWSAVQQNFNQKLAETKGTLEALGIRIGNVLLPKAQQMLGVISESVGWFSQHKTVAKDLAVALGIGATAFVAWRVAAVAANVATKAWMVATNVWKGLSLIAAAAQWVWNASLYGFPLIWILAAFAALVVGVLLVIKYHKQIAHFFVEVWGAIWAFLKGVGAWFAGPFVNFFVSAGRAVAAPFLWLWHNVLDPFWQGISAGAAFVRNIVVSLFNLWTFAMRNTLGAAALWLWHSVLEPFFASVGASAMWLWHNVIEPVGQGIGAVARWLWQNVFVPVGAGIKAEVTAIGAIAMWLWHNAIDPALHGVASAAQWLWGSVLSPTFHAIVSAVDWVGSGVKGVFSGIASWISGAFSTVGSVVKGVLNSVIDIINRGIGGINSMISTMNKVPGVNFPHIPDIPHLATGGIVQVGERGTEIVRLPSGSAVYPHGSVPADMASATGTRTVTFKGDTDKAFATFFKRLVRTGLIEVS